MPRRRLSWPRGLPGLDEQSNTEEMRMRAMTARSPMDGLTKPPKQPQSTAGFADATKSPMADARKAPPRIIIGQEPARLVAARTVIAATTNSQIATRRTSMTTSARLAPCNSVRLDSVQQQSRAEAVSQPPPRPAPTPQRCVWRTLTRHCGSSRRLIESSSFYRTCSRLAPS